MRRVIVAITKKRATESGCQSPARTQCNTLVIVPNWLTTIAAILVTTQMDDLNAVVSVCKSGSQALIVVRTTMNVLLAVGVIKIVNVNYWEDVAMTPQYAKDVMSVISKQVASV